MVDLPDRMPVGIANLPVNKVGYPVPWFVWWDPDTGQPDFRIIRNRGIETALMRSLCWICGDPLVGLQAFVIGPMCAINHTSAEPPSHYLCAKWAAIACPFLANPNMVRRENYSVPYAAMPGISIPRNPGVGLVWKVRPGDWSIFRDPNGGILFDIGTPRGVEWYAHGRAATRTEVVHSIETGLPQLYELTDGNPDAVADLNRRHEDARALLPL